MEFRFDVGDLFKQNIVEINANLRPPGFCAPDRRALWDGVTKVSEVINKMGEASATAQGLTKPITTSDKLRNSEHKIYLLVDEDAKSGKGVVTGMLKVGRKGLYVFDRDGHHFQVTPPCVLDFYIHETRQRTGLGKKLFEHMLEKESIEPVKMAIDRPSDKFLAFLNKHYNLQSPIKQMNNYVVFDGFFPEANGRAPPAPAESEDNTTPTRKQAANGLQSGFAVAYGRYGAPRPPCSMGQIIHNQSPLAQQPQEPTGNSLNVRPGARHSEVDYFRRKYSFDQTQVGQDQVTSQVSALDVPQISSNQQAQYNQQRIIPNQHEMPSPQQQIDPIHGVLPQPQRQIFPIQQQMISPQQQIVPSHHQITLPQQQIGSPQYQTGPPQSQQQVIPTQQQQQMISPQQQIVPSQHQITLPQQQIGSTQYQMAPPQSQQQVIPTQQQQQVISPQQQIVPSQHQITLPQQQIGSPQYQTVPPQSQQQVIPTQQQQQMISPQQQIVPSQHQITLPQQQIESTHYQMAPPQSQQQVIPTQQQPIFSHHQQIDPTQYQMAPPQEQNVGTHHQVALTHQQQVSPSAQQQAQYHVAPNQQHVVTFSPHQQVSPTEAQQSQFYSAQPTQNDFVAASNQQLSHAPQQPQQSHFYTSQPSRQSISPQSHTYNAQPGMQSEKQVPQQMANQIASVPGERQITPQSKQFVEQAPSNYLSRLRSAKRTQNGLQDECEGSDLLNYLTTKENARLGQSEGDAPSPTRSDHEKPQSVQGYPNHQPHQHSAQAFSPLQDNQIYSNQQPHEQISISKFHPPSYPSQGYQQLPAGDQQRSEIQQISPQVKKSVQFVPPQAQPYVVAALNQSQPQVIEGAGMNADYNVGNIPTQGQNLAQTIQYNQTPPIIDKSIPVEDQLVTSLPTNQSQSHPDVSPHLPQANQYQYYSQPETTQSQAEGLNVKSPCPQQVHPLTPGAFVPNESGEPGPKTTVVTAEQETEPPPPPPPKLERPQSLSLQQSEEVVDDSVGKVGDVIESKVPSSPARNLENGVEKIKLDAAPDPVRDGDDAAKGAAEPRKTPSHLTEQGFFDLKFYHNKLW